MATFLLHKQNLTDHEQLQQNYVKTAHLHVETTRSHQVMLSEAHMSFTDDFNFEHTNQLFTLLANCTNSITANISHCNPSYSTTPTATINYTRMMPHTSYVYNLNRNYNQKKTHAYANYKLRSRNVSKKSDTADRLALSGSVKHDSSPLPAH